jgi:hypothetical protein
MLTGLASIAYHVQKVEIVFQWQKYLQQRSGYTEPSDLTGNLADDHFISTMSSCLYVVIILS